jgi:hypothetical protein
MKVSIFVETKDGFTEQKLKTSIRRKHTFDGFMADIIELNDVKIHGVKDIEALIEMLEWAKPCFQSGNKMRNFFDPDEK